MPDEPVIKRDAEPDPIEKIRTKEPQAPFGQDEPNPSAVSDATAADLGLEGEEADPAVGGYEERDPEDEMPRVPTDPGTEDDPESHGAAADTDHEPPASTNRV
jgi:hypothetical protein